MRARGSSGPGATAVRSAWIRTSSTSSRQQRQSSADQPGRRRPAGRGRTTRGRRAPVSPRWAASSSAADHLVGARRWPARALPGDAGDERGRSGAGREHLARGELGQRGQRHRARLGGDPAGQLGVEGVARLARVVARADEVRQPLGLQPGRREALPAIGRRLVAPGVERLGRRPRGVAVGVRPGRQQPGRRRDLDQQRRRRLVELGDVGGRLEVAHRHGARAERDRRSGAPVVDQQLHPAYDVERGARGRAVDLVGGALGGRDLGRYVDPLPRRVAAAHRDLHLARARARAVAARARAGRATAAPRPGVVGLGGRDRLPRRARVGLTRAGLDVVEHRPRGRATARSSSARTSAGVRPADRVQRRQRPERVGDAGERSQPRVVLPDQGQVGDAGVRRPRQRRRSALRMWARSASVVWPDATRASRTESSRRVSRSRARLSDDRVAARDASWRAVGGCGGGEIGAFAEQRAQPLVRPAAELVGERSVPPAATGPADEVPIVPTLAVRAPPAPTLA